MRRMAIAAMTACFALLIAAAGCSGGKPDSEAAVSAGYGVFLPAVAVEEDSGLDAAGASGGEGDTAAARAADGSGMSGTAGKSHAHGTRAADMWRTTRDAGGAQVTATFDLGAVYPLGEMWVWNYNAADPASGGEETRYGLKEIRILYSSDGEAWRELTGEGHPYRLAKADGTAAGATNLEAEGRPPVRFGGVPARYVRLEADAEPGRGNWDEPGSGRSAYGLSEVRFYSDAARAEHGGIVVPVRAWSDATSWDGSGPEHAVNHSGMSGARSAADTHGSEPGTMWLASAKPGEPASWTADLGGTVPLGELHVWSFNGAGAVSPDAGLRRVRIYYSLDGTNWTELQGPQAPYEFARADGRDGLGPTGLAEDGGAVRFDGVPARFVKLVPEPEAGAGNWGATQDGEVLYGLSEVRFTLGAGLVAEPAPEWTALFSGYSGWTGADGIYAIPLNGYDAPGRAQEGETLFLFSDTYIGTVHPVTRQRVQANMLNNTLAVLEGGVPDPAAMSFIWTADMADVNLFTPKTDNAPPGSWYWLQDGVAIGDNVYLFPLMIVKDPGGAPGFQFAVAGVSMIRLPIENGRPAIERQAQFDTPLYARLPDGSGDIMFGAGVMDNTEAAGAPNPDGYVYVYGYRNSSSGMKSLLAARVRPEHIEDFGQWSYWDGAGWSDDPLHAAPLADGVSAELSVTPMAHEPFRGKYVLVSALDTLSGYIAVSAGDSPVGPFPPLASVYRVPESGEDAAERGIITYNAKAHPHLSTPGELLISYNVNTTVAAQHTYDADIYRPRWIRLYEIGDDR